MKCKLLTSLLLLCGAFTYAQNRIGLELGAGRPVFATGTYSEVNVPTYNPEIVLAGNANYLRKVNRHWYYGGLVAFEQYAFDFGRFRSDNRGGTYGTNVIHKSSYLNVGPMADVGIGRHRQYLHIYTYATLGFLLTGFQLTSDYHETNAYPNERYYNSARTDFKINSLVFRFGAGLKQQFPITRTWQAIINESYSFMPFGDVSQPTATGGSNLHPGYITLQFGMMHKFKDKHKNED
ncbi:MAG: hypothetical protein H7257_14515 [Taibaiella sp.]|nr:hypothetical protein [Taibaiella sp.]